MEFVLEIILSFFGEAILQIVFELLADFGFKAVVEGTGSAGRNRVLRWMGYFCLGAIAGGISLLLFPRHMIHSTWIRVTLVAVVPVLAGFLMSAIGSRRESKGRVRTQLEYWANGYGFALSMSLVRILFTK